MNKITTLTNEQFESLKTGKLEEELKECLGISLAKNMEVDGTLYIVEKSSQPKDVFRTTRGNGETVYYIVAKLLNDIVALCYYIHPLRH